MNPAARRRDGTKRLQPPCRPECKEIKNAALLPVFVDRLGCRFTLLFIADGDLKWYPLRSKSGSHLDRI
jgi:hypothetical protein